MMSAGSQALSSSSSKCKKFLLEKSIIRVHPDINGQKQIAAAVWKGLNRLY